MTVVAANAVTSGNPSITWTLIFSGAGSIFAAAIISATAFFGHKISQANTRLQVGLGRETARLSNQQSRDTARLSARLTANIKLAEMRQNWINNLRDEMTSFQALCASIDIVGPPDHAAIYKSGTRIELHMNPDDRDYAALKEAMYEFVNYLDDSKKREVNDIYISVCQRILKREWDALREEIRIVTERPSSIE